MIAAMLLTLRQSKYLSNISANFDVSVVHPKCVLELLNLKYRGPNDNTIHSLNYLDKKTINFDIISYITTTHKTSLSLNENFLKNQLLP